jgi:hypothetical protein
MIVWEILELFREWLILQGLWPPKSLDLTLPDLSLWGHLRGHAYDSPYSNEEWKTNIKDAVSNIDHNILHWVARNMVKQLDACISERGGQF